MKKIQNNSVKKAAVFFIALAVLSISTGCFHEYYQIAQPDSQEFREVVSEEVDQHYFVLYHRGKIRQFRDLVIQGETLQGVLDDLPPEKANFVYVNRPSYFVDTIPAESFKINRCYHRVNI
ncbi:MAG: hypothetical protein R2824_24480 [Saprospiraceae bacterium]|nr:hypothetical protein [Lewinella sp.]